MLREVLCEVLGRIPERGNGLDVFIQTERETVFLLLLGHELEGVVVDVAVQFDAGLDTPVPLIVKHQWVAEEEAGFVAAHVSVADGIAVDDLLLLHLLTHLGSLVLVNPLWERPVLLGNLAILGFTGHEGSCHFLELVVEFLVIEEDPIVVELAIETILNMANGFGNLPDVGIAGEGDKSRIHALSGPVAGGSFLSFGVVGA